MFLLWFSAGLTSPFARSQELFIVAPAASNIPARSINVKVNSAYYSYDRVYDRSAGRVMGEVSAGLTKKLMATIGYSASNMHTYSFRGEGFYFYSKYRFLNRDGQHQHFRMAAFIQASKTSAPFHNDETGLYGDKSGIEGGLIATQLWNRFALSGTLAHTQVLDASRSNETLYLPPRLYQSLNYALSSGYLLLPRQYESYRQVNVNLYFEVIGQQGLDQHRYFLDAAPGLQLIFFSNLKLNAGYRFQLAGNSDRINNHSWTLALERSFLNVWKSRR